jgi:hypothetical protein|tara:strand:+ start:121 stop:1149 length:1029 start_codon:yes stop_codon:yes gene_type:complete
MAKSYPRRNQASGIWKLSDITFNIINYGTFPNAGTKGVFAGGQTPSDSDIIDYITISSTGDAADFGDLSGAKKRGGSGSSFTRTLFGGGYPSTNVVEYITPSSLGNAADFGDLTAATGACGGFSNQIRFVNFGGGAPGYTDAMDYFTIASAGDATDFGNLSTAQTSGAGSASPTRGIAAGGFASPADAMSNAIDYFTIASAGNATDFGNLAAAIETMQWASSNTRAVSAGGATAPSNNNEVNTLQTIIFATTGNTIDYGDLTGTVWYGTSASDGKRGIHAGGRRHPVSQVNIIDYYSLTSAGNAADFGDLTAARILCYSGSNGPGHGGLEAFDSRPFPCCNI